jgi:phosphatidylserine/phosphatidylglycerophosphate/cardiolipin synthase-like enzyme
LLDSALHTESTFYYSFQRDLKHAKQEIIIESPFFACKRTQSLLPIFNKLARKGVKVRINTRNPRHHERELQIQAWQCIKWLRSVGVKVKFYDDMRHRKLAVIDRTVLWEGSLNIMSQSYSKEIMRRTKSETLAIQMIRFTGMNRWGF